MVASTHDQIDVFNHDRSDRCKLGREEVMMMVKATVDSRYFWRSFFFKDTLLRLMTMYRILCGKI